MTRADQCTGTTMVAALEHGRNSIGVECPSPHPMGRGIKGEVVVNFKLAASRLMNEKSSLFGQARFQIELKPHAAVEAGATLAETRRPTKCARANVPKGSVESILKPTALTKNGRHPIL